MQDFANTATHSHLLLKQQATHSLVDSHMFCVCVTLYEEAASEFCVLLPDCSLLLLCVPSLKLSKVSHVNVWVTESLMSAQQSFSSLQYTHKYTWPWIRIKLNLKEWWCFEVICSTLLFQSCCCFDCVLSILYVKCITLAAWMKNIHSWWSF